MNPPVKLDGLPMIIISDTLTGQSQTLTANGNAWGAVSIPEIDGYVPFSVVRWHLSSISTKQLVPYAVAIVDAGSPNQRVTIAVDNLTSSQQSFTPTAIIGYIRGTVKNLAT